MVRSFLQRSLLAGAALVATNPALADVKTGVDAWSRGDYAAAIREWKGPADKGDSDAQFNLGQAYKLGRGVPQDLAKAEALFAKAAAQGHMQASDNYGLLLFQRGERAKAMPYITAAAGRGDARAQYLLGLAHFNGENAPKDWVRAYALVSLAQRAGLPQAVPALAQMDQHIPLEQRQQSVTLASTLAAEAIATRARQLAAVDLGSSVSGAPSAGGMGSPSTTGAPPRVPAIVSTDEVGSAPRVARRDAPANAGADYTRPQPPVIKVPPVADMLDSATARPAAPPTTAAAKPQPARSRSTSPAAAPSKPASPTATPSLRPASPPAVATTRPEKPAAQAGGGAWRVQLGAFGVPANAEALWSRVKNRSELAGRGKLLVSAGKLSKLQAGGFATQAEAQTACRRLSAAGFPCLVARN